MLVRKFLRCKLTPEAQAIVDNLKEFRYPDLSQAEVDLIIQSLYKTERTWEME